MSWRARFGAFRVLLGDMIGEGPIVKQFEKEFGKKFTLVHCVAVNSGTSALELAYELAELGPGDEVLTPVLTCVATNTPILHRGATPVLVDINDNLVIDETDAEKRITKKTKAIVYVHFGGYSGGLKAIQRLAAKYRIPVIEDAAQSIGSDGWGTSEFTCVSLQAIKTLTSVDGGFLICRDNNLYKKAKRLRWFGYDRDLKHKYGDTDLIEAGYKYHMSDVTAAIGLGNLKELGRGLRVREEIRKQYESSGLPLLCRSWLIILKHQNIDKIIKYLNTKGIPSSPYHYRNDKYTIFGGRRNDLPVMDRLENGYTLLPFHHGLSPSDVGRVIEVVRKALVLYN